MFQCCTTDKGLSYKVYPEQEASVNLQKTPIVLAHGLFGSKGLFDSVCKQISRDGRKVFAYDARNHGDSEKSVEFTYSCMADDLNDFIDNQGLTQPIVMGHSMGGKTAMTLALAKPQKLKALIAIDIAPIKSPTKDKFVEYAHAMKALSFPTDTSLNESKAWAKKELLNTVQDEQILDYLLTNLIVDEKGQVKWRHVLDAFVNNSDQLSFLEPQNRPFTKPALFVFGEKSEHYRSEGLEKVETYFPNAEVRPIKDSGHFLYDDKPAEFVSVVQRFCNSLDGRYQF
ncbi:abhydrolase domain-containing protein 11 [Elysia marginata]|uniref:sn-1-specific diacylglycerol lipase ABHD11 n=1 Tax=Elysia marginata TaxID=1093978 RepID=A0AAV4JGN1_9GAST|nr:abhydrolase domain-containing protein 11 [Elysia marginata]